MEYATRFEWYVFPVRPGDKRPLIQGWPEQATTDPGQIQRWWKQWPNANIGVACGPSQLVVIDLDVKGDADGLETWHDRKTQYGFYDDTVTSLTPSGGMHLLFFANGVSVRNSAGKLGPGVDVRAEGGYIVVPPSRLDDGCEYVWEVGAHPDDRGLAPLPAGLVRLLEDSRSHIRAKAAERESSSLIREGDRNSTLTSLAGTMRRRGMEESEIAAALLEANRNRCVPPLAEKEVRRIAGSVSRYQPALEYEQAHDLDALLQAAIDSSEEDRVDALQELADALAHEKPLTVEHYVDNVKEAGLTSKTAFRKAVKEAGRVHRRSQDDAGAGAANLPRIEFGCRPLPDITDEAWAALKAANDPTPFIFRYAGLPTVIDTDDEGAPVTRVLNRYGVRHHLARVADWDEVTRSDPLPLPAPPPMYAVLDVQATADPPLPILEAIVETPVFAPDATLQSEPGYQPKSRTYYVPPPSLIIPNVPSKPSSSDVERALSLIFDEFLVDFPFTGPAEKAHALSLMLLPFARPLIAGPTPLHLVEKPTPGTGGTLFVSTALLPALGRPVATITEGRDEDEWRKRLTSLLLKAPAVIFIDNLRRPLDASSLSSAITTTSWEDRILGASTIARVKVRCLWVATGNNPQVSSEIARRTVRIRMDARMDRPWLRREFKHPNLLKWAKGHRAQLVWACLTLIQNWVAKGKPRSEKTLGMFEEWSAIVGGILEAAGVVGFLGNLEAFYEQTDDEGNAWRSLIALWWGRHHQEAIGASEVHYLIESADLSIDLGTGNEQSRKIRLGKHLREQSDRCYEVDVGGEPLTLRIVSAGTKSRAAQYRLLPEE